MTRPRPRGSILLISLSLISVLAVMAVAIARTLALEVRLTRARLARAQAQAMARGGVYLAMQRLLQDVGAEQDGKTYDWYGDGWAVFSSDNDPGGRSATWTVPVPADGAEASRFPGALRVRIFDEAGKLPLNRATPEQLTRLLDDDRLAQTVVDVIDAPEPGENRPDDTPPYFAKNGPVDAIEELAGLDGMTPEGYHVLEAQASPYLVETDVININTASAEVLRAVGLTEGTIRIIVEYRDGPDGSELHELDGVFPEAGLVITQTLEDKTGTDLTGTEDGNLLTSPLFGVTSDMFLVSAEGLVQRPAARARVTAVVRRAGCDAGRPSPCIVAWREG